MAIFGGSVKLAIFTNFNVKKHVLKMAKNGKKR